MLGCGLANLKNDRDKLETGKNRLFQILVSESAHLLWKIRCQWVIGEDANPNHKPCRNEALNRWTKMLIDRINGEILAANNPSLRKAASRRVVHKTWKAFVRFRHGKVVPMEDLPRFLVGMRRREPP
ncbi:MAG TPA: hypothetical protein VGO47_04975 [Chlamydiales bacterium]|nr:hypothetical protein [Chlamydiales bacterium]